MTKEEMITKILEFENEINFELKQTIDAFGYMDNAVKRLEIRSAVISELVELLNLEK